MLSFKAPTRTVPNEAVLEFMLDRTTDVWIAANQLPGSKNGYDIDKNGDLKLSLLQTVKDLANIALIFSADAKAQHDLKPSQDPFTAWSRVAARSVRKRAGSPTQARELTQIWMYDPSKSELQTDMLRDVRDILKVSDEDMRYATGREYAEAVINQEVTIEYAVNSGISPEQNQREREIIATRLPINPSPPIFE